MASGVTDKLWDVNDLVALWPSGNVTNSRGRKERREPIYALLRFRPPIMGEGEALPCHVVHALVRGRDGTLVAVSWHPRASVFFKVAHYRSGQNGRWSGQERRHQASVSGLTAQDLGPWTGDLEGRVNRDFRILRGPGHSLFGSGALRHDTPKPIIRAWRKIPGSSAYSGRKS